MRPRRWTWTASVFLAAAWGLPGCKMFGQKSHPRDPLTMSHLTHGKNDPLYAGTDSDMLEDEFRPPIKAASVSRKPDPIQDRPPLRTIAFDDSAKTHAADYSWIRGELVRLTGRDGGWYIRYARPSDDDRFGGKLRFANSPRLGLLREGDTVQVEGALVDSGFDRPSYRVDSIVLRD